ncbi:primosomal protein N' (replication factor Y) [Trueperella bonasi]|uniref:Primosomal protein N' (Replication factor Y) n=1 Tax=Trueperella bonasi TaxID=312286 RepID=A0ABT9NDJ8_9ACTO|nr:hypothetical protein [Trueperella bonasi]MDP9805450.1 primosomal protein N' (replication factor Y) [Trueperella bonasi]
MSESDGLFNLPDYGFQEELLSLDPVARDIESGVELPVARVLPDIPQPHMDRFFDYEIPQKMANAEVGARVVVDIGSRRVDGFIVERSTSTNYHRLRPIHRLVSSIGVLTPEVLQLCRSVASRQASPVSTAVRLAVPQRHARAEKEFLKLPKSTAHPIVNQPDSAWNRYIGGAEFVSQYASGKRPSAAVQLLAGDRLQDLLPFLVTTVRHAEQSIIVVLPTSARARKLQSLLEASVGEPVALMVSEDDHATRYLTFLEVLAGRIRIVVGTRSAVWAPVKNPGLLVIIDDQHSAFAEPRAPYIHAREVLTIRAHQTGAGFLAFNYGPSAHVGQLTRAGFTRWITPAASELRNGVAQTLSVNDFRAEGVDLARMPSPVFKVTRSGLERGPVLFVVPQAGYVPLLACQNCREIARCVQCTATLAITQPDSPPVCTRCSLVHRNFSCSQCRGTRLRAIRIGSQRTAQEIGRAFRGETLHIAGVGQARSTLDDSRRIVVSTPGVIPTVEGGYASGIILDAGYLLRSSRLEAEVYFLRTIAHTAGHIRARANGGKLLVVGDVPGELIAPIQSWNFADWVDNLLEDRCNIGLPPTAVWVEIKGPESSLREFLGVLRTSAHEHGFEATEDSVDALFLGGAHDVIPGMAVLGPNPAGEQVVAYVRFAEKDRQEKTALIYSAYRAASAHRIAVGLRIVVDPPL